jgi:folate-dependent phosphoribosylglycinamide formyltransferase PurN
MERSSTIVYLGAEQSLKSSLGLEEILRDGWNVVLVVSWKTGASSEPVGRVQRARRVLGNFLRARRGLDRMRRWLLAQPPGPPSSSLAATAAAHGVECLHSADASLREIEERLVLDRPDVLLSNGWLLKIPDAVLATAKRIALNCHSSYLPEYRGGNSSFAPLINGERESGVTVHEMTSRIDAGRILAQERVMISKNETPESLNAKRARASGNVLIRALEVAGHPELYRENPPSKFYYRCGRRTFRRFLFRNRLRRLLGMTPVRYEPGRRYE